MPGRPFPMAIVLRTLSALAGAVAGLLILRLIFRMVIADPANPSVALVYTLTRPLLFPWAYIWPPDDLPVLVLEKATLLALASYMVVGITLGLLGRAAGGRSDRQRTRAC